MDVIAVGEGMVEFTAEKFGGLRDAVTFVRAWGGDTSSFAVAISRLGLRSGYITRVGDDEFGACLLDMWRREGVDVSHVIVEKGGRTGIYFISFKRDSAPPDYIYFRSNSAASHLSPSDVDSAYIGRARALHVSGITQAISRSARLTVSRAIKAASEKGLTVSYDPNVRLKLWLAEVAAETVKKTLRMVDIALPSLQEGRMLFTSSSPEEVAAEMLSLGPRVVAMKMAGQGCVVATRKETFRSPGFAVKFLDPSGAGDVFDAAFLASMLQDQDLHRAAEFANAAAALKCCGKGAVIPIPRRDEVERFLRRRSPRKVSGSR